MDSLPYLHNREKRKQRYVQYTCVLWYFLEVIILVRFLVTLSSGIV